MDFIADAPSVMINQEGTLRVMAGESLTLTCQVDANPSVTSVKWYRGGILQTGQSLPQCKELHSTGMCSSVDTYSVT